LNSEESVRRRIDSVLGEVERRGFEAVVFLNEVINQNPSNFVYVCPQGLGDEHQSLVLDVNGGSTLVMPHWGASRVEESGRYGKVIAVKQEKDHHMRGTKEAISGYDPEKICFDLSTVSSQFAHELERTLGIELDTERDVSDHIFKLRTIKDDYEVGEIKRAIRITEEAVTELVEETYPGRDTWRLKKRLDATMIEKGASSFSFESSLSFARGAHRSHGTIKHGDMLSLDVGCRVETGYCSDMGRTWPITLDADALSFLERAVTAQNEGIKNIREGVTGNEVLRRAQALNEELDLGRCIRTGHQIGLDVHDYTMPHAPSFGPIETDDQPLKAGMTLTYEPNRRDDKLGMRCHFEDVVLVTKGDPVVLNEMPWNLLW